MRIIWSRRALYGIARWMNVQNNVGNCAPGNRDTGE